METFQSGFQDLLLLSECEDSIDEFALVYAEVLQRLQGELRSARDEQAATSVKDKLTRLKTVLIKQINYANQLKREALVREFEEIGADVPAMEV